MEEKQNHHQERINWGQEVKQGPNQKDVDRDSEEKQYPSLKVVIPAMGAIYLCIFLVALDRTIIGTAIPTISAEFNSFGDISWYESGFLLPLCTLQLTFGRVLKYYSTKWVLICLVTVFEIGSIVCAAAPNSDALIIGRVVAGIGAAGTTSSSLLMINLLAPLQTRPRWTGGFGAMFGISSIIGPILGGYLTSVSWRWCFWINVPIGGVSLALLVFLTPNSATPTKAADTWRDKFWDLDPLGFLLIGPATICFLFAIQWGGTRYAWSNARIIVLFVLAGSLGLAFIGSQIWCKDAATVPPRIFWQRSIFFGCFAMVGIGSCLVIYAFYLPVWFQVVQGKSPQSSGLSLIPLLISNVLCVISGGVITSIVGYYTPLLIGGSAILIIGAGLITTWEVDISTGKWIGYQIVTGAGLGFTLQQPNIAAQTVLSDEDVSVGFSVLNFFSFLSGTVFVTVSQNLLDNSLTSGLGDVVSNFDPATLTGSGATSLRSEVSAQELPEALDIYNDSMRKIWYLTLGLACIILVSSFGMEWKSIKKAKKTKNIEHGEA